MATPVSQSRRVAVLVLLAALLAVLLSAAPARAVDPRAVPEIRTGVQNRVNTARTSRGLRALKVHSRLQRWAQDHAEYMASKATLVHDSAVRQRLEAPPLALSWSENIARTMDGNASRSAHSLFMHSSGHRANILRTSSTHMGIGIAKRGPYTYVVQRFAALP